MKIVAPTAALAPFVRELMIVEVGDAVTRVRLPETGLVLGVRYRGAARLLSGPGGDAASVPLPNVSLAGLTLTTRRMRTEAGSGVVLARFRAGGAAAFFRQPLHELLGAHVPLGELLPRRDVDRLGARVAEGTNDAGRVAALEAFLLERLRPGGPDPIVAAALQAIEETRGALPIGALARRLAISQDPLEKRFRRAVGASPKQLASLVRLRHAIDAYRPGASLAQLALDAGYFDQSHFSRALRAATGQPPGRFLRTVAPR